MEAVVSQPPIFSNFKKKKNQIKKFLGGEEKEKKSN
jgi:hypothetical protein